MEIIIYVKMKPAYIFNEKLLQECDRLPAVLGRASLVHNLIASYNILEQTKIVRSKAASYEELKLFHSELYLDHLKTFHELNDEYMSSPQDEEYGLGYDCPSVSNMFELVSTLAGGSITAAKCLMLGLTNVAINWCGGWHHAQRFGADGFCYVNDIVLAIETLKQKFPRILYVDLDVHHGNGVQNAYNLSKSVFTLSFHKFEPGFYPGTGGIEDIGTLAGTGYSCNFPLHAAFSDNTLEYVFEKVFEKVYKLFSPDVIVVQCGADALAHDPHGGANLSIKGYTSCLQRILDKRKPMLLLGGGGYKHTNAARLWASLTAQVTELSLDEDIPEHDNWPNYGPDFMLTVEPTLARDSNKKTYLDTCVSTIIDNLEKYLGEADGSTDTVDKTKVKQQKTNIEFRKNITSVQKICDINVNSNSINRQIEPVSKTDISNEIEDVYTFKED